MRTRVVSNVSFVIPGYTPQDPHTVCRAALLGERLDKVTNRRWFEVIGRFACGHGMMLDVLIFPWCIREALQAQDVPQHWDFRLQVVNERLRTWLDSQYQSREIYARIGGKICCDDDQEEMRKLKLPCNGWQMPRKEQLLKPVRELILSSRQPGDWYRLLSASTNGQ